MQSREFWLHQHQFPQVTDVLLLADLQLSMLLQQPLLLAHAQLSLLAADPHEASVPARPETAHPPHALLLRSHHVPLLHVEETLREGVVDVDRHFLVLLGIIRTGKGFEFYPIRLHQFPDIVLCDVVGVVGTATDLVERAAFRNFDLVGVKVILGLDIAEDEGVGEAVRLALRVDLVQRLVEYVEFFLLHLHDAAHKDGAVLLRDFGDGVVEVLSEGGVDVGGEAGGVDALLLLDDFICARLAAAALAAPALLVRLPLLLLRVADPHQYYQTLIYQLPPPLQRPRHRLPAAKLRHSRNDRWGMGVVWPAVRLSGVAKRGERGESRQEGS